MAKPLYVYTGSQWVPVASELESTSQYATTTYVDSKIGLIHLRTETFTSATTVSLNNIFNSTYDAYKIFIRMTGSAAANTFIRLRASGSDNSSTIYRWSGISTSDNSATIGSSRSTGNSNWLLMRNDNVSGWSGAVEMNLIDPFASRSTKSQIFATGFDSTPITTNYFNMGSTGSTTTSFDGFTLHAESGNATGSILVFGVKQ